MSMSFDVLNAQVVEWARERGILMAGDSKSQMLKCVSEVGELADAVAKGDIVEIVDGLGDVLVTMIILAELKGLDLTDCLESAYDVIKNRKGKMQGGVFVKDAK